MTDEWYQKQSLEQMKMQIELMTAIQKNLSDISALLLIDANARITKDFGPSTADKVVKKFLTDSAKRWSE